MSSNCGQLGRTFDDSESLYDYPPGDLTEDDFSHHQLFRKTETRRIQFEFKLISPIEFSLHLTKECQELTKLLNDSVLGRRFNYHRESSRHYIFNVKHYSYIHSMVKNWQEDGILTANYNSLDSNLIQVLKNNGTRNDSITTFIQNSRKNRLELIGSLELDPYYQKTIQMMNEKRMFDDLYDNQLVALYMAVIRHGKCILADLEGKSLSAITAMTYFRKDWPLVIVCATERKTYWADQMYSWDEKFAMKLKITVITAIKEIYTYPDPFHDVIIIDYDTLYEVKDTVSFQCIGLKAYIFEDQTRGTDRSRQWKGLSQCCDTFKNISRAIFIWGPEFEVNKYRRLYPLLNILDPKNYPEDNFDKFEERYCNFDNEEESNDEMRRRFEFQIIMRSTYIVKCSKED